MAACRHPIRSQCNSRTCRDCEGAGSISYPGPYGRSPYDVDEQCTACDGTGRIEFRPMDVLERLRYQRTYGSRFHHYPNTRREAYQRVPLPDSRYARLLAETEAFRRAECADASRQMIADAVSLRGAA